MIPKEFDHRGHRGRGIISFFFAPLPTAYCLLLLAPLSIAVAQSPELVQAKAKLKELNVQLEKLGEVIEQDLEAALAGQVDTTPKNEFETTTEYQARLAAAKEARQRLEPEFERKKADRRRTIMEEIETLTSVPYPAPIRIRLGTYDADSQTFPFFVRATGDSGTIEIPREVAPEIRTNLGTLRQTGYWRLMPEDTEQLAAVAMTHASSSYMGVVVAHPSYMVVVERTAEVDETPLMTLTGHSSGVSSVVFSPDGLILASGDKQGTINLWNVNDGKVLRTLTGNLREIHHIKFLGDGDTLISRSRDQVENHWRVIEDYWRVSDGVLLVSKEAKDLIWEDISIPAGIRIPNSNVLIGIAVNEDKTIRLYRDSDWYLLDTIEGHSDTVRVVAFSPDGQLLASGSDDKTIKLWRVSYMDDQFFVAIRAEIGGAVAARAPSLPPTISVAVSFTEPSGDNILDAYEEGALEVTLTNSGQGAAYGVEIALSGETPDLSFPARCYVGEIPPGKSQQASIPLKAGLDLPDGKATLTCAFTEANGFEPDPVEITFETRAYRPPQLALADVGVDEPSGNGMIEPGEVVTVMVRVQNRGRGAAEDTKARVNIGKNVFAAAGSETQFDLGAIPPGAYQDIQFQIYTNRRASEIPVTVTLTERHGKYGLADAPLELPFNQPVRSIQQVVVEGKAGEEVEVVEAGGLSVDIERDIPAGRDQRRDAVALIIANRRYLDPDVPDVDFAHRDGEFVKQYLVRTLGYREGNIFLYRDATLSNFRTALRKLRNAARRGSEVFVYYTGHGAPDPDEKAGYFVPVDCDPNYVKIGGVALNEFYAELGEIRAGSVTVVIDACFSGASEAGMLIQEASPVFISVEDPAAGLKEGVVLTSASGDQISSWHPEQQHSLYTYYFLKGLQGTADANGDRSLTVGELQAYLEEQVPYMARRLHNRTQTPMVTPGSEQRVLVRYK